MAEGSCFTAPARQLAEEDRLDLERVDSRYVTVGRRIADRLGLKLKLGNRVPTEQLEAMAAYVAEQLLCVMRLKPLPPCRHRELHPVNGDRMTPG